jgi:hypothetical protein
LQLIHSVWIISGRLKRIEDFKREEAGKIPRADIQPIDDVFREKSSKISTRHPTGRCNIAKFASFKHQGEGVIGIFHHVSLQLD